MVSCEALRFMPGFGPGTPFRFSELDGGASRPFAGAAVVDELESAAVLTAEGVASWAELEGDGDCVARLSEGNLMRLSFDRRRIISFDLADDLAGGLADAVTVEAVLDMAVMMDFEGDGGLCCASWPPEGSAVDGRWDPDV
jgi:hypothetical protein